MPDYKIKDPTTGKVVTLRGESPPTEAELEQIFSAPGTKPDSGVIHYTPGSLADSFRHAGEVVPEGLTHNEPGFLKRISDMGQGAAHPQSMGDFLQLIIPAGGVSPGMAKGALGAVGNGLIRAGRGVESVGDSVGTLGMGSLRYGHPLSAAVAAGTGPVLRGAGRAAQGVGNFLNPATRGIEDAAAVEKFMGGPKITVPSHPPQINKGQDVWGRAQAAQAIEDAGAVEKFRGAKLPPDPRPAVSINSTSDKLGDLFSEAYKPQATKGIDPSRIAGPKPTLSDEELIQQMLADPTRKARDHVKVASRAPKEAMIRDTPDTLLDELTRPLGETPGVGTPVAGVPPQAPGVNASALPQGLVERLIGPNNRLMSLKPEGIPQESWRDMRSLKGARDVGRELKVPADDVRRLSGGGPSKTPLEALERILRAAEVSDPLK